MLQKILETFKTVFKLIRLTWLRLLLLWVILTVVAYGVNFFIPKISSSIAGKGFNDEGSPFYQWSTFESKLLNNGMSELKNLGKTNVFFLAIYGSIEFLVHNTLLSLIAGLYAFFMLGALKRNDFGLRMMVSSIRPALRFTFGLWFAVFVLLFAGLIGAVEQIYFNSQSSPDTLSMLAAWSLAGSAVVISLCVLFIRLSPLPYIRAESSERFTDSIRYAFHLTTANSINIGRLIPQIISFAWASAQWKQREDHSGGRPSVVVPSGNFGNVCAALYAREMGIPFGWITAATNANDVVPQYLSSGSFAPQESKQTISNAMDVG
ncbi:MAG: hypothetical protein HGB11_15655, partial [Chlorobiales bacterium]|nr:hypothetical protein [Chlorobiales bacterium]